MMFHSFTNASPLSVGLAVSPMLGKYGIECFLSQRFSGFLFQLESNQLKKILLETHLAVFAFEVFYCTLASHKYFTMISKMAAKFTIF